MSDIVVRILLNTLILVLQTFFEIEPLSILFNLFFYNASFYLIFRSNFKYPFIDPVLWGAVYAFQLHEGIFTIDFITKVFTILFLYSLKETLKTSSLIRFLTFVFLIGIVSLIHLFIKREDIFYVLPGFLMSIFLYSFSLNVLERSHLFLKKIVKSEGSSRR